MSTPTQPLRIAVMAAPSSNAEERRLAALLARTIQWAGANAGRDVEAVLALNESAADTQAALLKAGSDGTPARLTRWRTEPAAGSQVGNGEGVLVPADGGNDFLDCDLWLVVGAHPDLDLPRVRPYAAVVSDCAYRYHPELLEPDTWGRLERNGCALLRNAALVLVHTARTAIDVRSFAGVPERRVLQLPVLLPAEQSSHSERPCSEDYLLWLPGPSACERPAEVLRELRHYYENLGGKLHTVIAGSRLGAEASPSPTDAPIDMISRAIAAHGSLREHIVLAEGLADGDRLAALQQARLLLHTSESVWPGLTPLDAAWLNVPILAARDSTMLQLDQTLGLAITFFDPGVAGDLAAAMADLEKTAASTMPSRDALAGWQWWARAAALVDALLARCADRISHAYR